MKRLFLVLVGALLLTVGCSTKYDLGSSQGGRLESGQRVAVITPADGAHDGQIYVGSGAITAALLQSALLARSNGVTVVSGAENLQAALQRAASDGCRYAFYPQLVNWEPRAAAWSGRPTRVDLIMSVYDLRQGRQIIKQQNLEARGRISTLVSQTPGEILKPLLEKYADQVF